MIGDQNAARHSTRSLLPGARIDSPYESAIRLPYTTRHHCPAVTRGLPHGIPAGPGFGTVDRSPSPPRHAAAQTAASCSFSLQPSMHPQMEDE